MTDYTIVGGGLLGLMQARGLAKAGARVRIIERGEIGKESSWAGGGILSPLYPWRYPDPVNDLATWSQQHYAGLAQALIEEGGIDPQWTPSGLLVLDTDEAEQARAWADRFAVRCEHMDRRALSELVAGLHEGFDTGLWFPDIAQIRNPRLVKSLLHSCTQHQVEVITHAPVTGLNWQLDRLTGVQTAQGNYASDSVIITAGAWSAQLLEPLYALPVSPVKGQMIMLQAQPGQLVPIVLYQGSYLIPRRDGRILVGSTLENSAFDKHTTQQAREGLLTFVRQVLPELAALPVIGHWAGLRPGNANQGIPYICAVPNRPGLYINTGHFRNGVVLAPASCQLMGDILLKNRTILNPELYRVG